jgi:phage tail-like protein
MADDGAKQAEEIWPLPGFHFQLDFGDGITASFQEVSGLDTETDVIEFRHSNSPAFSTVKMPGVARYHSSTLKKGLFAQSDAFLKWYQAAMMKTAPRRTVTVTLLGEGGGVTMRWALTNAWLTKVSGADLKSEGETIAVETIVLSFEALEISQP